MDTVRVDICYRPLRIGWVIASNDWAALRRVVRLSHTLWGGRFNPILLADRTEAAQVAEAFRVDFLQPVGNSADILRFVERFPHLPAPFSGGLFVDVFQRTESQVLDVANAMSLLADSRSRPSLPDEGLRHYTWEETDPLADALTQFLGAYPSPSETGSDYLGLFTQLPGVETEHLESAASIPASIFNHPTIAYLSRHDVHPPHSIQRGGWDTPGFFVGAADSFDDLVDHWNLRAADIRLLFVDPTHAARFEALIPAWDETIRASGKTRKIPDELAVAVWSRDPAKAAGHLGGRRLLHCRIADSLWNGLNVRPPMMHLGSVSALGVVGSGREGRPRLTFPLQGKPFNDDLAFCRQHLVASLWFNGLYGDELHTLQAPFIPELNDFLAGEMRVEYNRLRVEPGRIGVVVDAADTEASLYAVPVPRFIEAVLDLGGFNAKTSRAGLITRQIIERLDGVHGCNVFKISGVRRLIKTYGPTDSFDNRAAKQIISAPDPEDPRGNLSDFQDLYIERREPGTPLLAKDVLGYLIEKGLFRAGADLQCPTCLLTSWVSLEGLAEHISCQLCGASFLASRQIIEGGLTFRRSGLLGLERNLHGAVPVALTLHQLYVHLGRDDGLYSVSLDLVAKEAAKGDKPFELDLVWMRPRSYPKPAELIIGECKGAGTVNAADVAHFRAVLDALPANRVKGFALVAKLGGFTDEELALLGALNGRREPRVILLTTRELEPYRMYERTNAEFGIDAQGTSPEEMAQVTQRVFFGGK